MANGVGGDAEAGANGAVQILLAAPAHLDGHGLDFGATLDRRSILHSTVGVFALAIALGLGLLASALYLAFRKGRRRDRPS